MNGLPIDDAVVRALVRALQDDAPAEPAAAAQPGLYSWRCGRPGEWARPHASRAIHPMHVGNTTDLVGFARLGLTCCEVNIRASRS